MDILNEQMLPEESINYCINPKCQQRQNPDGLDICEACNTPLLINNRYRAVRKLHQSDRTEIFELQDWGYGESGCDTPKILKVLTDDNDPNLIRLFQQEELILRQLQHLGIPKVFPGGYFTFETSDGNRLHCLVMEQIEGKNLEQWLQDYGTISQEQAINWLKQLTNILKYVHSQGFFHRDIKPSNIMCRPDGTLVLIDFGAVRRIKSDTYIDKYQISDTTLILSSGYTPPEQLNRAAIPKSDLFALGRTFVHLLTGGHPNCLAENVTGELIWRGLATQISVELADLIDDMIAVNSQLRVQNPSTVLQRLAEIECGNPISNWMRKAARKINLINNYWGLNRRNSRRVQLGVGVSLFVGVTAFKLFAPSWAISFNNCATDSFIADKLNRAQLCVNLSLMMAPDLGESHYIQGLIFDANGDYQAARNSYEKAIGNVPDKSLNNLARLDIIEKRYAAAIPRLERGLMLVKEVDLKSTLHKNMGWVMLEMGNYQEAETQLRSAIALNGTRAAAYCLLGRVEEAKKDSKGAFMAWQNCLKYAPNEKYQPELDRWVIQAKNRLEVQGNDAMISISTP